VNLFVPSCSAVSYVGLYLLLVDLVVMKNMRIEFYLRLLVRLDDFIHRLDCVRDLTVHQRIDQSFYMEGRVELQELIRQYNGAEERLQVLFQRLDETGNTTFLRWRHDVRLLMDYQKKGIPHIP
jgi:hypothetical protein